RARRGRHTARSPCQGTLAASEPASQRAISLSLRAAPDNCPHTASTCNSLYDHSLPSPTQTRGVDPEPPVPGRVHRTHCQQHLSILSHLIIIILIIIIITVSSLLLLLLLLSNCPPPS